jgi:hypothetical protein
MDGLMDKLEGGMEAILARWPTKENFSQSHPSNSSNTEELFSFPFGEGPPG